MSIRAGLALAACCALVGGCAGGLLAALVLCRSAEPPPATAERDEITASTVRAGKIVAAEIVCRGEDEQVVCRMKDGSVDASRAVTAAQLRAGAVLVQTVLASDRPTSGPLEEQRVLAELAATPETGGVLILRNREGAFVPGGPGVREGCAIYFGYDDQGRPLAYVQDVARGAAGRSFLVRPTGGSTIPARKSAP